MACAHHLESSGSLRNDLLLITPSGVPTKTSLVSWGIPRGIPSLYVRVILSYLAGLNDMYTTCSPTNTFLPSRQMLQNSAL